MKDEWLPTLTTASPQEGFELAVNMARMGEKYTQPSDELRSQLLPQFETSADRFIASSQAIAIHYQTIALANQYWS